MKWRQIRKPEQKDFEKVTETASGKPELLIPVVESQGLTLMLGSGWELTHRICSNPQPPQDFSMRKLSLKEGKELNSKSQSIHITLTCLYKKLLELLL
jgi:hypothetical protein